MNTTYKYRKPVRRSVYAVFRRHFLLTIVVVGIVGILSVFIYANTLGSHTPKPVSATAVTTVYDPKETFIGPYFQFQDTGKWSQDKHDSTANKLVYQKYRGNVLEHELDVYINQIPIPLNLAVP